MSVTLFLICFVISLDLGMSWFFYLFQPPSNCDYEEICLFYRLAIKACKGANIFSLHCSKNPPASQLAMVLKTVAGHEIKLHDSGQLYTLTVHESNIKVRSSKINSNTRPLGYWLTELHRCSWLKSRIWRQGEKSARVGANSVWVLTLRSACRLFLSKTDPPPQVNLFFKTREL